jgi:hypothetical protein
MDGQMGGWKERVDGWLKRLGQDAGGTRGRRLAERTGHLDLARPQLPFWTKGAYGSPRTSTLHSLTWASVSPTIQQ